MKRAILLSIVFAILFLPKSNAQQFHFVTSFGVTQSWGMPYEVVHAIEHDYWGYDVVHTSRINQHGKLFFDVVLQRGDVFVTVSIGRRGRIYRRVVTYDYPFYNHVCSNFCGYHSNFYRRNVVVCNSHHHHGHNHVTYVRRNYNHHPGNGHAYGHYKKKGNKHYGHSNNRKGYRDTNSYKSRENSREYQSRSSNRYTVSNDRDAYNSRSDHGSRSSAGSRSTESTRSRGAVRSSSTSSRGTVGSRSGESRSSVSSGNRAKTSSSSSSRSGRSASSRSN